MDNEKLAEAYDKGVRIALEEFGLLKEGQARPVPPLPKKAPPPSPKKVPLPKNLPLPTGGAPSQAPVPPPPKNLLASI